MTDPKPENAIACNECQAGHLHLQFITYFTWLDDELITVPDFPAWHCDVCGRREYDQHALNQLSLMLNPHAGKPNRRIRRTPQKLEHKSTRPSKSN